jgi:hypothetical protein
MLAFKRNNSFAMGKRHTPFKSAANRGTKEKNKILQ